MTKAINAHILLTGATGFVGKVVLEQLLRQRNELGVASVTLVVRTPKEAVDAPSAAAKRFESTIGSSPLFRDLPSDWKTFVHPLAGDLEQPLCGLSAADYAAVVARTTHVIHCAASVEFDLPIAQAASANVVTALAVLELARACNQLVGMVDVSTAYVNTWTPGPIEERLAHLPRPATELYADIREHRRPEAELLAETGHPNTYTFTKCIAEHLISERRGNVPVTIVRPSVVSAAWREPFAGWLDSTAALAGAITYSGLGFVRAWQADPNARLDVVPVDVVASEIVDAAFSPMRPPSEPIEIRHATVGVNNAMRIDLVVGNTLKFFTARPGSIRTPGMFLGRADQGFPREDFVRRIVPTQLGRAGLALLGRKRDRKRLERADERVQYLNSAFGYFTHYTFDFQRSRPLTLAGFGPAAYLDVIHRGIYQHLLRHDQTQESFAGKGHKDPRHDLAWLNEPRQGSATMRTLGLALRMAMRQAASNVTFDRLSFERAIAAAPGDALFVLAPSHRSYLDFLLTSFLFYVHPELGVNVPHIAAAQEFSRIPLVGRVLRESRAFYIKRGVGREAPELSSELRRLSEIGASLMFFIEGQRSRSRMFLAPKRGLLRGLQATGRTFAVLPISISYDRLPEEQALERELLGGRKSKMGLAPLLRWLGALATGKVSLGRVHIACGDVQVLDEATDVNLLAKNVVAAQQQNTAISSFHLRTFLAEANLDPALGIDEAWLTRAIEARGGRVLASDLDATPISPTMSQALRNQWMHWFYPDAMARYPGNIVISDHVTRNMWASGNELGSATDARTDIRTGAVVEALMQPILRAYETAATLIGTPDLPLPYPRPRDLIRDFPSIHLPLVEDAYAALAERNVMSTDTQGTGYTWSDKLPDLDGIRSSFTATTGRFI